MDNKRISLSQPSRGCLKEGPADSTSKSPRKDRRVSFFERTHVRQVYYGPRGSKEDASVEKSIAPEIPEDRRRRQESFEIPTKGANESMDEENNGIVNDIEFQPNVDHGDDEDEDDDSMNTIMTGNESLESPTGSDLIQISKSFADLTPIRPSVTTPLRHSFTYENGWTTTDMSIVNSATKKIIANTPGDNTDMDLTECITGKFEVSNPTPGQQSTSVNARISTGSTMELTKTFGNIISVNRPSDTIDRNVEALESPSRRYSLRSSGSPAPITPIQGTSDKAVRRKSTSTSTPISEKKNRISLAGNTPAKAVDSDDEQSNAGTPYQASHYRATRGMSAALKDLERAQNYPSLTPIKLDDKVLAGKEKCLTTTPTSRKKDRKQQDLDFADLASPSSSKRRLVKKASNSSDSSSLTTISQSQTTTKGSDSPVRASQLSMFNTDVQALCEDQFYQHMAKESPSDHHEAQNQEDDVTLTGLLRVPITPMKVDKNKFISALAEYLNREDLPDFDFLPEFQPSVCEEACNGEIESYEEVINHFKFALNSDKGLLDAYGNDPKYVEDMIMTQFDCDFDGFKSMLEFAHEYAGVTLLQKIASDTRPFDEVYETTMHEWQAHLAEIVNERDMSKYDTSPFIAQLEAELKQSEEEYITAKARYDEVTKMSDSERQKALKLEEECKFDIARLKSEILKCDTEIEVLDKNYEMLQQQQKEQQALKDSIKFNYEEIPSRDADLERAKDEFDLLQKVSCWSIEAVDDESSTATLNYRQGLATVVVGKDKKVQNIGGRLKNMRSGKSIGEIWTIIDQKMAEQ